METMFLTDSWAFTWIILPVLIFLARILDVSIGTLRLIFVSKGFKIYAPILGFFEVVIWLLAIGQIMQHLDNFMCYFAYGLGFATGNYIGIYLDEKMSLGTVLIRVVPKFDTTNLINHLRADNFGTSDADYPGAQPPGLCDDRRCEDRQGRLFPVLREEKLFAREPVPGFPQREVI